MGSIRIINDVGFNNVSAGILGTSVSNDMLSHLSNKFKSTGNSISNMFNHEKDFFIKRFVQPMRKALVVLKNVTRNYTFSDTIKSITTKKGLLNVPPVMHDCILRYKPINDLLKQDRIFGFGLEYEDVKMGDPYARMINNGLLKNAGDILSDKSNWKKKISNGKKIDVLKDKEELYCISIWKDSDPSITFEELDYIQETRDFIDEILANTNLDPTDFSSRKG